MSNNTADLASVVLSTIQQGALPVATSLDMRNMLAVDEGSLGDFPWFWQSGTNFNANTYNWLNNVFAFNPTDNDLATSGQNFMTEYFNVLMDLSYVLSATDANALNSANLANARRCRRDVGTRLSQLSVGRDYSGLDIGHSTCVRQIGHQVIDELIGTQGDIGEQGFGIDAGSEVAQSEARSTPGQHLAHDVVQL